MRGFREYVDWEVARKKRFLHPYLVDRKGELLVDYLGVTSASPRITKRFAD